MTKFTVSKGGVPLGKEFYTWNERRRTFRSNVDGLVLDFSAVHDCIIIVHCGCTIIVGDRCVINVGHCGSIRTGDGCYIVVGDGCNIVAGDGCDIKTSSLCSINMGYSGTCYADNRCQINAHHNSVIKTGGRCVVVREDIFETIILKDASHIKLDSRGVPGYEEI